MSTSGLKVFDVASVIAASKNGKSLTVIPKQVQKDPRVKRFDNKITAVPIGGKTVETHPAILSFNNKDAPIIVTKGPHNPNDTNDINVKNGWGMTITTTVGKSGDFGQAYVLLNGQWMEIANGFAKDGTVPSKTELRPIINETYSEEYAPADIRGKKRDDPTIRLKVELDEKWPDKHPVAALRGTVKTQVLDYRTRHIKNIKGADGKDVQIWDYLPAKVKIDPNGPETDANMELVTSKNFYKFCPQGAKIVSLRVICDGSAKSASGLSWPQLVSRVIIDPTVTSGFADEHEAVDPSDLPPVTTPAVNAPAVNAPVVNVTTTTDTPIQSATVAAPTQSAADGVDMSDLSQALADL